MGDEDGEILKDLDSAEMDASSGVGRAGSDWPSSTRIDVIGQNGNDGDHYDKEEEHRCT